MTLETLLFKEINIFPELFLGISIVYLTLHSTFISINKHYILIQNSLVSLGVLVLLLVCYLLLNNQLDILNITNLNNTIINDYLSFSSKLIICFLSLSYLIDQKLNHFEYVLLILFSILGLFVLISSNDLLTAYLAIELQSLSFYILTAFKKNSTFSIESGIKYFILGSFSSCLFLFGSSLLYGITGTINFEDFKDLFFCFFQTNYALDTLSFDVTLILVAIMFILISLFFKLAIAPFHVWAPDIYEGSPSASSFFFSVVPKLSIFVLLFRLFYFSFYSFLDYWRYFIIIFILLTIIVGSFGGLEQRKLKSLLVYSSISHMGYSLIAFTTGTFEGIQILFCYLIIYSFSGLCVWSIFMLTRLKNDYTNKQNKDLTDLVLLGKSNKMLAIFFTTVLFSIAGFPPMIGFIVKISVFLSAIEASMYFVALLSILGSVIATFYYIRIIKILFFEQLLIGKLYYPINTSKSILVVLLFFLFLFLFTNPTLLFLFSYKLTLLSLPM